MIIAELCQNHNGQLDLLQMMVVKAAQCGAKFAKIQTFFSDDLSPEWAHDYDRLKKLELDWEAHAQFVKWCKDEGVIPMTSVYTEKYLPQLHQAGFQYIKFGSAQSDNATLIQHYMATGFKCIISTGGHDLKKMPRFGPLAGVLHCNSKYPTSPKEANLSRMLELKYLWPNTPYGYSSHVDPDAVDWDSPLFLASYLGATFIEVHFTLLDKWQTKDGPVSIRPSQFLDLCRFDNLSQEEKLKEEPWMGVYKFDQAKEERDLISKYKTRWRV